jgi:hypothetical protein
MAGSSRTVELKYKADISSLKENLAKIPGLTEKEAKAMVKSLDRNLQKAEKAAKRAAKNSRKEWQKFGNTLGKVAKGVAGAATAWAVWNQKLADNKNELLDMSTRTGISAEVLAGLRMAAEGSGQEFGNLSRVLAKVPKLMGDADRGVKLAVEAFADLGVNTHDAMGELRSGDDVIRDTMKALGDIEDPTLRAVRASDLFGASGTKLLQALGDPAALDTFIAAAAEFGVDVGPGAADAANRWQREMAGLKTAMWGAGDAIGESMGQSGAAGVINDLAAGIVYLGTTAGGVMDNMTKAFGASFTVLEALWLGVSGHVGEARKLFDELAEKASSDPMESVASILDRAATKMGRYQAAQKKIIASASSEGDGGAFTKDKEGAEGAATAVKDLTKQINDLAGLRRQMSAETFTAEEAINNLFIERILAINKIAALTGETAEVAAARSEAVAEADQAEHVLKMSAMDEQFSAWSANQDALQDGHDEELARIAERKAKVTAGAREAFAGIGEALAAAADLQSEAQGVAAQRLFILSKGAAMGEIAINTAVAITKALAQLGPIGGPLAAAGIGASGAAQAAVVASQEMPSFHMGGVIGGKGDGQVISALRGEAVLTRQAVSNIGAGGVNALNSGQGLGGGSMPLPVYKHFDRFARDEVRRGGELRRAIRGKTRAGQRGY